MSTRTPQFINSVAEKAADLVAVKAVAFLRDQPVLTIAALAAAASMFAVPPSAAYLEYLDVRVLGLLFCLMLCVSGLQRANLFSFIASKFLSGERSVRFVSLVLVLLCFFSSMFVTNDVALIALVPFTLFLFTVARQAERIALVVVLQTLAANLGSMVTPIGNPQNLFLFAHFESDLVPFMLVLAPYAVLSLVLLVACSVALGKPGRMKAQLDPASSKLQTKPAVAFVLLFIVAALTVAKVIPLLPAMALIAIGALVFDRGAFRKVDYFLLLTFVCFFVFSGNLANIPWLQQVLSDLMGQAPFAASLVASQFISNVPSAVLLAPFTTDWQQLLLGVDIGGLGTPVASLASLISLELYRRARVGSTSRFLLLFAVLNIAFLAANIGLYLLLS
ncbi:MAG: SLC13 family permease [Coriobacteriia bacterium]|nr:SLC13 family permease [Coriobacteriia bacterium]